MNELNQKIEKERPTQRRFAVMGENTFIITNKLMKNQRLCRLLKYPSKNPFALEEKGVSQPDVDGIDLINKQILIIPKIYDDSIEKMSYVAAIFDEFITGQINPDFKLSTIRFVVACPYDEWILNDHSLRPYLIMEEIDQMFNKAELKGIGKLQFIRADILTLSSQIGGYSMEYRIHEFN